MAGINNNLYPPIMPSYLPAFVINSIGTTTCKIYFSISDYNSYNDIKHAQIAVKHQRSNKNMLNIATEILVCPVYIDINKQDKYKYYIELKSTDLITGFEINQYYKIQIRFSKVGLPPNTNVTNSWLYQNTDNFSEWSTVCLLRGISEPHIELLNFDFSSNVITYMTNSTLSLNGHITYSDIDELESIHWYRAYLYDMSHQLVADSGLVYIDNPTNSIEINYTFKYQLVDGNSYILKLEAETSDLYLLSKEYTFMVLQPTLSKLPAEITLSTIEDLGAIQVTINPISSEKYTGQLMIRRTSNESNFTCWEDIHRISLNNAILSLTWLDCSIESGIWYKYCIQKIDNNNNRGIALIHANPIMLTFEDMFISGDGNQLRIKYNPSITNLKHTLLESKTETLGSRYPFIQRNGAVNYRQFALSGLITIQADYNENFITLEKLYGGTAGKELYDTFNVEHKINEFNDYITEREYREQVMNFLYNDSVKLIRTLTEGNILVRLMDISLNPEIALGRMLYSFTATAIEIDNCTLENMLQYNVINTVALQNTEDIILTHEYHQAYGQLANYTLKTIENDIVSKVLTHKYQYYNHTGYNTNVTALSYLKLEFNSLPYLIYEAIAGQPKKLENTTNRVPYNTFYGYIAYINNVAVVIPAHGYYELQGDNINITSLYFLDDIDVNIYYMAEISTVETINHATDILYNITKVGQLWGSFKNKQDLIQDIWKRYYSDFSSYYQYLVSVNAIRIEANPGTVFWLRDSENKQYKRFVLNQSGYLSIFDNASVIESLYFAGTHFEPATADDLCLNQLPHNKYVETNISVSNLDDITNPIMNGIYTLTDTPALEGTVLDDTTIGITKDKLWLLNKIYALIVQQDNTDYTLELNELNSLFALGEAEIIEMIVGELNQADEEELAAIPNKQYAMILTSLLTKANKCIYHNGDWHLITENYDIFSNVDAVVDYGCDILRGVHTL